MLYTMWNGKSLQEHRVMGSVMDKAIRMFFYKHWFVIKELGV